MDQQPGFGIVQLLPLILIGMPFAFGFYHVAGRLGRNGVAWAILSLVPIVNYFFWIYAAFVALLFILDRLRAIAPSDSRAV
jgi:hypothetical protein